MKNVDFRRLRKDFERDGYIFIRGFLSVEEVNELKQKLALFIQNVVPTMPDSEVFYENKADATTLKQLINLNFYDAYFEKMLKGSRFDTLAAEVLGETVLPKTLEYFNKPPRIGQPTPPHQDAYYFKITPQQAATMWLALEDADEENGCVRYVKGSHQNGMRSHQRTQINGFSQGIVDFGRENDCRNEVAFPAQAGDLLVHHAMTIHRAGGNASQLRSRRALGFIYFGESAQEDTEAKKAYQQRLNQGTVNS